MKFTTIKSRNLIIVCLTFALSACVSKPRMVEATKPLVSESFQPVSGTTIPQVYWPQLNQAYSKAIAHHQYKITLKPPYVSALGNECRELLITGHYQSLLRIACVFNGSAPDQREWRLMPSLESNNSNISL